MSDRTDDRSGDLMAQWRQGDQQAAAELFRRYANRLIELARSRMPSRLNARVDPEDVVQSVYRSFFAGAREGRYELQRGGDLWRLLVTITMRKLYHQVERNLAGKRALGRELTLKLSDDEPLLELPAHEPGPIEAVALADELERLMRRLEPLERRILELRLQGFTQDEIAAQTQRSLRTVCRLLEEVKQLLEQQRLGQPEP